MEGTEADTMLVGLHGTVEAGPRTPDPEELSGLVVDRTVAYGWGSFLRAAGAGRWEHQEAGGDLTPDGRVRELAWLQLAVTGEDRPQRLPVLPAVTVLGDVLRRVARPRVTGLHALLPMHLAPDTRADLAYLSGWFDYPGGDGRAEATVTVWTAGGAFGPELVAGVRERGFDRITVAPGSALPPGEGGLAVPRAGGMWTEPLSTGHGFRCGVPEWSVDAAVWLTEIFTSALRDLGVSERVLLTAGEGRPDRGGSGQTQVGTRPPA